MANSRLATWLAICFACTLAPASSTGAQDRGREMIDCAAYFSVVAQAVEKNNQPLSAYYTQGANKLFVLAGMEGVGRDAGLTLFETRHKEIVADMKSRGVKAVLQEKAKLDDKRCRELLNVNQS